MIAIVRIRGRVGLNSDVKETLYRLRLRRKYSCVVMDSTKEQLSALKKLRDFVAFGEINKETLKKLIEKRGQLIDKKKKIDANKIVEELEKGKKYSDLNLKPFFRLHPPRKGIESKKHFGVGKGVLGDNKDKINDLIERML
ncbi:50S ribosomal protein L30P [archaeon BMS3Abin17]|nr:50S ribosomal protein L30P [archaeon BMS3Abin17]HDZ60402.1 50S ribosomal protein L30 [Candidatus Pacearchaeota archaeon]